MPDHGTKYAEKQENKVCIFAVCKYIKYSSQSLVWIQTKSFWPNPVLNLTVTYESV